jgi:hypothetical protein
MFKSLKYLYKSDLISLKSIRELKKLKRIWIMKGTRSNGFSEKLSRYCLENDIKVEFLSSYDLLDDFERKLYLK